jgi:1-acyl-sn-glycerol-3-phosphate acyltransferase
VEALEWHVARHPDRAHLTLLDDQGEVERTLSYAALAEASRRVAAGLIARDVGPGDRIALMLPTGIDFFSGFFGALYAGAVPVPIYPPARLSQIEEHMQRQAGILRNAGARILLTVPQALTVGSLLRGPVETLEAVETVARLSNAPATALPLVRDSNATAFIQYTSGSTGDPKGVVLSHANLLANIRAIGAAVRAGSDDVFVSWLPLYHDLGLVGGWLGCLYFGAAFYVMSPLSFLARPENWLWAVHRFRGTLTAAPNFAFELCVNKIDDADIAGLDLGSLRVVANGAEPVSVPTLRRFARRFERYGFKPEAMMPAFGLAENTVVLTVPPLGRGPLIDRVERKTLGRSGIAEPAAANDQTALEVVSCGRPLPNHDVRIADDLGHEAAERHEGRLEFRGPSATSGYFGNAAKTRELFHDGWLDTGDLAYMVGGEVFVTGRVKDIIIRGGQHIYPQEIEDAVSAIPGLIKNGVAAFGVTDAAAGTERTIVMAETAEKGPEQRRQLQARARDVATDILGAPPDDVVLLPPQTVPKTSSLKIRRGAARDLYLSGQSVWAHHGLYRQLVRLAFAAVVPRLRQLIRQGGTLLYAGWWWAVVGLTATLCWIAGTLLPRLDWRWGAIRGLVRLALRSLGVPLTVAGLDERRLRGAVLVFNHASYADALVVAAVVPGNPVYVAKRDLAGQFFAGLLLRRLGVYFVQRYDVSGSMTDTQSLIGLVKAGRTLVFFPEGTFTRRAGMTAFYLGAFKVAAEAGAPVVPGSIRGTRSMLRGEQWFPQWSAISVHFADPIAPTGTDFAAIVQLRDRARAAVLPHCGEPDLGGLERPERPA